MHPSRSISWEIYLELLVHLGTLGGLLGLFILIDKETVESSYQFPRILQTMMTYYLNIMDVIANRSPRGGMSTKIPNKTPRGSTWTKIPSKSPRRSKQGILLDRDEIRPIHDELNVFLESCRHSNIYCIS